LEDTKPREIREVPGMLEPTAALLVEGAGRDDRARPREDP
jgi:hypothetical protein